MFNYKITISYNGKCYCGSQYQPTASTIQGSISQVLEKIYKAKIKIIFAGRTDSGVHAESQVLNFKCGKFYKSEVLKNAINANLPNDIKVIKVEQVDLGFDAKKNAKSRVYKYLFTNVDIPFYLCDVITKIKFEFDESNFKKLEQIFIGEKDFVNFRKLGSNELTTIREIQSFRIFRDNITDIYNKKKKYKIYVIEVIGNAFLYSMIRNIAGAIFEVLKGKRTIKELENMLNLKSKYVYTTAQAKGLSLIKVNY